LNQLQFNLIQLAVHQSKTALFSGESMMENLFFWLENDYIGGGERLLQLIHWHNVLLFHTKTGYIDHYYFLDYDFETLKHIQYPNIGKIYTTISNYLPER